jgi:hypothetical protein
MTRGNLAFPQKITRPDVLQLQSSWPKLLRSCAVLLSGIFLSFSLHAQAAPPPTEPATQTTTASGVANRSRERVNLLAAKGQVTRSTLPMATNFSAKSICPRYLACWVWNW